MAIARRSRGAHVIRVPGWERRLAELELAARGRSFAWGMHDCCTWAAECVHAVTGQDVLADLRGRWRTEPEAAAVLRELGGLRQAVTQRVGTEPLPTVLLAQRGDLVLLALGNTQALGVCMGAFAVAPAEDGLARIDMTLAAGDRRALLAWRI